jgi:hypothetical protein
VLNADEREMADALDRVEEGWWTRNFPAASQNGYGIPLPIAVGASNTFYPDFLWWIDGGCCAIETSGQFILEPKAMSLCSIGCGDTRNRFGTFVSRALDQRQAGCQEPGQRRVAPSGLCSCRVAARRIQTSVAIANGILIGAVDDALGDVGELDAMPHEVVPEGSRITQPARSDYEHQKLVQERGRNGDRERRHVLIGAEGTARRKARDVARAIEAAVAFELHMGGFVLADANEARSTHGGHVRSPDSVP